MFCLICQALYIKFIVSFTNLSSIKILSFSWNIGQKHREWISSSTRFKSHISHNRSSAGTLRYLPVAIDKGRIPLLSWQNIDRLHFAINKVTYNIVLGFISNRAYVRNLGLNATLIFHWWVSFSTRCYLTVCNGICEMSFEVISKYSSRNIDFTLFTQPKLLFLMYFNTFEGNLCSFIIIVSFHNFLF